LITATTEKTSSGFPKPYGSFFPSFKFDLKLAILTTGEIADLIPAELLFFLLKWQRIHLLSLLNQEFLRVYIFSFRDSRE